MSPPDDSLPGTGWRAGSPVMTPVEGGGPWSGSRVVTRRLRAVLVAAREAAVTPAVPAVPARRGFRELRRVGLGAVEFSTVR